MSMYRDHILDHYKHPRNFGELPNADVSSVIDNPLCGDKLKLQIKYHPLTPSWVQEGELPCDPPPPLLRRGQGGGLEEQVVDVKFTGTGCAISMASASLLTEYLKNKTRAELLAVDENTIYKLLGIEINPGRVQCALLPLVGLKEILRKNN